MSEFDNNFISTIRMLSIDMVENAKTGHLGTPLSAAPMAYCLYKDHMRYNPVNPNWINRDRFILSSGHATPLLYSLLNLFAFDVKIDDIKEFRKLKSRTPGHPEIDVTPGVDASTGPLGQGFAMSIGFAMAEARLSNMFNKENFNIIDHYTYVICGDGDLMEGVANEAASLAGTLKLNKLIVLYDSNDVCSDGLVEETYKDNTLEKFNSIGWNTILVRDGNNVEDINKAIENAKKKR